MNAEEFQPAQSAACYRVPPSQPQRQTQYRQPPQQRMMPEEDEEYKEDICRESEEWVRIYGIWSELPSRPMSNSCLLSNSTEDYGGKTELCSLSSSRQLRNKPIGFQLTSLPAHIRQQIYTYVLTDLSTTYTLVHITRAPRIIPSYKVNRPQPPKLLYRLDPIPRKPFATALLLVNRELYHDALPILYARKTFYPHDLEGLLPLFLNNLSPFARQNIRRIRLSSEPADPRACAFYDDRTKPAVHWAITCAQVATLNSTLHGVEVSGHSFLSEVSNRLLLYPLCKIKAKKTLVSRGYASPEERAEVDKRFEELLWEASEHLKAAAKRREESAQAEAVDRARRHEMELARVRNIIALEEKHQKQYQVAEDDSCWVSTHEQSIDRDLAKIKGMRQFEAELDVHREKEQTGELNAKDEFEIVDLPPHPPKYEDVISDEWDVVSTASGGTSSLGCNSTSDDEWQDTASTLAETFSGSSVDNEKTKEDWEDIDK